MLHDLRYLKNPEGLNCHSAFTQTFCQTLGGQIKQIRSLVKLGANNYMFQQKKKIKLGENNQLGFS